MNKFKYEPLKNVARSIIVDTDIGPDCDDVGALVVLFSNAKKYNTPILGIVNCTSNPYGNGTIDIIGRCFGYSDIPIGMWSKTGFLCDDSCKSYNKYIAEHFKTKYEPVGNLKAENSLKLYRRLLAGTEDKSVVIVTIGPLNTISEVLMSKGDEISPDDGHTLIEKKVYAVVTMAGATMSKQREYNIVCDPDAAETFLQKMPVPVIYSGFELGIKIDSGFDPNNIPDNAEENPIFQSYKIYTKFRNMPEWQNKSYDLTAVHFAFEGEGEYYKLSQSGRMVMYRNENNETEFVLDEEGQSFFMDLNCSVQKISNEFSRSLIDAGKF